MSTIKDWQAEYKSQGIPSSFRQAASGVVKTLVEYLGQHNKLTGKAIDLGAGRGRNSFYLAQHGFEVLALDFVESNVAYINQQVEKSKLPVVAKTQSVAELWPLADLSLDLVIDVFCFKHLYTTNQQAAYITELLRCLKSGGIFLISLAGIDDGYYGPLLKNSLEPKRNLIVDPVANIQSILYTPEQLEEKFAPNFTTIVFEDQRKVDQMHGRDYMRSTLMFIMQKM